MLRIYSTAMTSYLIKLFCHPSYDGCMFHGCLHGRRNFTLAAGSTDEELHQ